MCPCARWHRQTRVLDLSTRDESTQLHASAVLHLYRRFGEPWYRPSDQAATQFHVIPRFTVYQGQLQSLGIQANTFIPCLTTQVSLRQTKKGGHMKTPCCHCVPITLTFLKVLTYAYVITLLARRILVLSCKPPLRLQNSFLIPWGVC
jgi:hypothetical protein